MLDLYKLYSTTRLSLEYNMNLSIDHRTSLSHMIGDIYTLLSEQIEKMTYLNNSQISEKKLNDCVKLFESIVQELRPLVNKGKELSFEEVNQFIFSSKQSITSQLNSYQKRSHQQSGDNAKKPRLEAKETNIAPKRKPTLDDEVLAKVARLKISGDNDSSIKPALQRKQYPFELNHQQKEANPAHKLEQGASREYEM
ncbi:MULTISPECIES: hypothetical protein [Cysteiniphilum]|uniref:hypothetical protein n=2 Tax=Fastidiosibacteraceae TaxID=2056687 RepID=UPI00177D15DE|nr:MULTISPECIES: hypothetical protein [Cysteiniphilum]